MTIFSKTKAAVLVLAGASLLSANVAAADGLYSYEKNGVKVCIGLISCLFTPKSPPKRNANGVNDHRERPKVVDHRDRPAVRDHRPKPVVRDHRN